MTLPWQLWLALGDFFHLDFQVLDGNAGILLDVIEDIAVQIVQAPGQGFAVGHIDAQIDAVTVAAAGIFSFEQQD